MKAEKMALNVKSETGRKLVIETAEGKDETYYLNPIRSLRMTVEDLSLSSGFSRMVGLSRDAQAGPPSELAVLVTGEARLTNGPLAVIGGPERSTQSVHISFRAPTTGMVVEGEAEDANKATRWKPTPGDYVLLWYMAADWEIGSTAGWYVDCELSQPVFDALVVAIQGSQLRHLRLGLDLMNIYTDDDYAQPSVNADWFLRPNKRDNAFEQPEMAKGRLSSFDMCIASVDLRAKGEASPTEADDDTMEEPAEPVPDRQAEAIQALAQNIEKLRGTLKWVGGFVAVFLAILAIK